jgi:hypothetical protein
VTADRHSHGPYVEGFSLAGSVRVLTLLAELDGALDSHVIAVFGEGADGRQFVIPCPECGAAKLQELLKKDLTGMLRRMEEWKI